MEFSDYIVYVDESGDHSLTSINPDYPVFVLCFCIINKEKYLQQIVPELQRLKMQTFGHDQIIIHEHDLRKKKGDFCQLNKELREQFMEGLSAVMDDADLTIVAVVIEKERHLQKYTNPYHPYHLALQFGLERIYSFLKEREQHDKITHVIFEERGPKEDMELELEFRRVRDGQNRAKKLLPFNIVMASKKSNSTGLQLADITARPLGLSVLRPEQKNQALDIIKKKLYRGRFDCVTGNGLKVFP